MKSLIHKNFKCLLAVFEMWQQACHVSVLFLAHIDVKLHRAYTQLMAMKL